MLKRVLPYWFLLFAFILFFAPIQSNAMDTNDFHIIPKADDEKGSSSTEIIENVGDVSEKKTVIDNYNTEYKKIKGDIWKQMKTWVMGWDTILDYIVYLVRFLSQIGLLIWGMMIIYAGYLYGSNIFTGKAGDGKKAIKNAIIGILVIIFSYAIMKTLTSMFL